MTYPIMMDVQTTRQDGQFSKKVSNFTEYSVTREKSIKIFEYPSSHPFLQAPLLRQERSWVQTASKTSSPQPQFGLFLRVSHWVWDSDSDGTQFYEVSYLSTCVMSQPQLGLFLPASQWVWDWDSPPSIWCFFQSFPFQETKILPPPLTQYAVTWIRFF